MDVSRVHEAAENQALEWMKSVDRSVGVGRRHHTVPVVYLQRFADSAGRALVRRRDDVRTLQQNIKDLSIKDFYTFVAEDGELDGSLEQILGVVEGNVAPVLAGLSSPLFAPRPLSADAMGALAQFLSFQIVRGTGHRREIELMADFIAKSSARRLRPPKGSRRRSGKKPKQRHWEIADEELAELRIVPHPNEHLRVIGPLAERLFEHIVSRPATVVELAEPHLITCDEPVIVNFEDDHVQHTQHCLETARQRRIRVAREAKKTGEFHQGLHIYPTRSSGVANAEEIALTLSPSRLLILGKKGGHGPRYVHAGADSVNLAREVNAKLAAQALDWLAAHPGNPVFSNLEIPDPSPLVNACDGATPISKALAQPPSPRRPQRLRKDW